MQAGMIRMAKVQEGYMDHQDRECVFDEAKVLYREAIRCASLDVHALLCEFGM